jgi:hypothetical protein
MVQDARDGESRESTDLPYANLFNPLFLTLFCPNRGMNISCAGHCYLLLRAVSSVKIRFMINEEILCRSELRRVQTVGTDCVLHCVLLVCFVKGQRYIDVPRSQILVVRFILQERMLVIVLLSTALFS